MRFVITKNVIENVIASMQPFLEKKDSSSITSHIYLEINNAKLIIKATDYEIGLESHIDNITDMVDGKITVNGSNLLGIIKRLKNEEILFEVTNNNLVIKQNKSTFKLPTYDANEYPSLNRSENLKELSISTINFINSICSFAKGLKSLSPKMSFSPFTFSINTFWYLIAVGTT